MFEPVIWFKRRFNVNWKLMLFSEKCYHYKISGKRVSHGFYTVYKEYQEQVVHQDIVEWLNTNCNKDDYKYVILSGDAANNPNPIEINVGAFISSVNIPTAPIEHIQYSNILGIKFLRKEDATMFRLAFL